MTIDVFKQIKPFAYQVMRQSNTRHLSWNKQFASRLQSEVVTPMGASVPALLGQGIAQHAAATQHEDDCYLIITKSDLTPQIAALDKERDDKWVGTKSMADALSRIGSAEQQQYAGQLMDLASHYKIDISERYDDETTKLDQLLQVLKTPEWTPRIAALGLTATIADLDSINQQMKQLIEQRNNELATITPQAMVQARQATDEAYALVVAELNAFAIAQWADGSSPYDQAIARINQDQDYYEKNVFAQGKGGSSNGSNDNGNDNGNGNNDNGGDDNGGGDDNNNNGGDDNNGGGDDNNNSGGGDNGGGGGGDDNHSDED